MAGGKGDVFSFTLEFPQGDHGEVLGGKRHEKEFALPYAKDKTVRIGRCPKAEVLYNIAGISWQHAELRLRPAPGAEEGARPILVIRDLSSNGTGIRPPGEMFAEQIDKGAYVPVLDGTCVMFPMKVTNKKESEASQRVSFTIRFHSAKAAADPADSLSADEMLDLPPEALEPVRPAAPAAPSGPSFADGLRRTSRQARGDRRESRGERHDRRHAKREDGVVDADASPVRGFSALGANAGAVMDGADAAADAAVEMAMTSGGGRETGADIGGGGREGGGGAVDAGAVGPTRGMEGLPADLQDQMSNARALLASGAAFVGGGAAPFLQGGQPLPHSDCMSATVPSATDDGTHSFSKAPMPIPVRAPFSKAAAAAALVTIEDDEEPPAKRYRKDLPTPASSEAATQLSDRPPLDMPPVRAPPLGGTGGGAGGGAGFAGGAYDPEAAPVAAAPPPRRALPRPVRAPAPGSDSRLRAPGARDAPGVPAKVPPTTHGTLAMPAPSASGSGAGAGGLEGGLTLPPKLVKGEETIRAGRQAEEEGRMEAAYRNYRKGIRYIMEGIQKLGEEDARVARMRALVREYLERAATVKDKCGAIVGE